MYKLIATYREYCYAEDVSEIISSISEVIESTDCIGMNVFERCEFIDTIRANYDLDMMMRDRQIHIGKDYTIMWTVDGDYTTYTVWKTI